MPAEKNGERVAQTRKNKLPAARSAGRDGLAGPKRLEVVKTDVLAEIERLKTI